MSTDLEEPNSLVKLDAKGKAVAHWREAGASHGSIAVDGTGTVLVVGQSEDKVSVWDGAGKLVTRWGQRGHDPGDFPSPLSGVAMDGHGHVVVLSWSGVQLFDVGGKYRGRIAGAGGRALALGPGGDVYVLDDAVRRYTFKAPSP